MKLGTTVKAISALAGLFFLVGGGWALLDPLSFYDQLATYPPYNLHLFHDVGAFQIGLGAALLLPLVMKDAALVGLTAVALGAALHAVSHIIDRDLGGRSTNPIALSGFAAIIVVGAILRARELQTRRSP
ncbi:MAG: pyridoxamine 5'-phosphate oxidase [Actinomycetota bacterium]